VISCEEDLDKSQKPDVVFQVFQYFIRFNFGGEGEGLVRG
jgi:hypothetical protein